MTLSEQKLWINIIFFQFPIYGNTSNDSYTLEEIVYSFNHIKIDAYHIASTHFYLRYLPSSHNNREIRAVPEGWYLTSHFSIRLRLSCRHPSCNLSHERPQRRNCWNWLLCSYGRPCMWQPQLEWNLCLVVDFLSENGNGKLHISLIIRNI